PEGAGIIPNPFNRIPGFSYGSHYFVPGFPEMAWPMIAWVLDTYYADSFHQVPHAEQSLLLFDVAESTVTPLMEQLEQDFPQIKVFSLPSVGKPELAQHIELGVKGNPEQVKAAFAIMLEEVQKLRTEIRLL
ncbi:MAG: competence/damage-inducible protein A, partial [Burkholderiales bacterium]|nr:competence/damage-inducible protein A [Burkholderiales bacterium]